MGSTSKKRKPSQCKEWEKQRRLKFNQAVTKLGELIKSVKSKDCKNGLDTTQYPKIEIIQRAIALIVEHLEQISRLKSETLSLQVKLDGSIQSSKKDAATQISLGVKTKLKDVTNKIQEDPKPVVLESNTKSQQNSIRKLPTLLPKTASGTHKKAAENTIVVLPAAPYVLPPRPFMLPSAPPTFFLLNSAKPQNKKLVTSNRESRESTKTTMVNILPITAFSHPLSAKTKKSKSEVKKNKTRKKVVKKLQHVLNAEINSDKVTNANTKQINGLEAQSQSKTSNISSDPNCKRDALKDVDQDIKLCKNKENNSEKNLDVESGVKQNDQNNTEHQSNSSNIENQDSSKINKSSKDDAQQAILENSVAADEKDSKDVKNKSTEQKDNKLNNVIDNGICDNSSVDVGNTRLELAEELLAASPTAAFLMTFPLVSGNRADSPTEDSHQTSTQSSAKDNKKTDTVPQAQQFYKQDITDRQTKTNDNTSNRTTLMTTADVTMLGKKSEIKSITVVSSVTSQSTIVNSHAPLSSLLPAINPISDAGCTIDFDCNRSFQNSQNSFAVASSNLFYKSDFNNVKSSIYSTSAISSGHDYNTMGLYPCAVDKYGSKSKSDLQQVEENLMKIGSSRLTYDIDLGWSHKGLDFISCPTSTKDNIMTTVSTNHTNYNPFNPDFHAQIVGNTNKKDISYSKMNAPSAAASSAANHVTNLYPQPTSLWSEETSFYANNVNAVKQFNNKQSVYSSVDNSQNAVLKQPNPTKIYDAVKQSLLDNVTDAKNTSNARQQITDKFTKKSPSKSHINWMTSETRPLQNHLCNNMLAEAKEQRPTYTNYDQINKKQDNSNLYPLSTHNFPSQITQEEYQSWPTRTNGTAEITIEPPPINLPTLVGDLALGPHDRKKHGDNRLPSQTDLQNCNNFLSVTQLMNGPSDTSRFQGQNIIQTSKTVVKTNTSQYWSTGNKNVSTLRTDNASTCYPYNDSKVMSYDEGTAYQNNRKTMKTEKNSKSNKNNYSAEALIRGGTVTQKFYDDKFNNPAHRFNDFNMPQDSSIAQVSHFPSILDYTENNYTGQQFAGTSLYNSTSNPIPNSFYPNFMTSTSNLMTSNYSATPFAPGDFIDYSQTNECSFTNHKYEELKIKTNAPVFSNEKTITNHKTSKRETASKHKLECSKKESNKRYQSKKNKISNEGDEWGDSNFVWHNKGLNKRHTNVLSDDIGFPSYVGNQMASQYQPDIFSSHNSTLVPTNVHSAGANADRTLTTFPSSARANFNLSSIFPEITMKVQT